MFSNAVFIKLLLLNEAIALWDAVKRESEKLQNSKSVWLIEQSSNSHFLKIDPVTEALSNSDFTLQFEIME